MGELARKLASERSGRTGKGEEKKRVCGQWRGGRGRD